MDDDRASTEPCRPPSTKRQKRVVSGAAAKDDISEPELLQRLEKEAAALEECICTKTAELDRLRRRIASIRPGAGGAMVDGGATVADDGEQNDEVPTVDISSLESNCLASIISYLDPQSVGRCEMTSKATKGAAELAWPSVEESTTHKDMRSRAGSAKERVVLHFTASRFARKVEARVVPRDGNNKSRHYLHVHPSYLPSHGIIDELEDHSVFVRVTHARDANVIDITDARYADQHLLSQGFCDAYQNYRHVTMYGEDLRMGIGGLEVREGNFWPHMPDKIMSIQEKVRCQPQYDEFTNFILDLLVTVVAVHKETRKAYLLSVSWGFHLDRGWQYPYEFSGNDMRTCPGSEETCRLKLIADTGEYCEEGTPSSIGFELEYYCPTSEYVVKDLGDSWYSFDKRKSRGKFLVTEDLIEDDLDEPPYSFPECNGETRVCEWRDSIGKTFKEFHLGSIRCTS